MANAPIPNHRPINLPGSRPGPPAGFTGVQMFSVLVAAALLGLGLVAGMYMLWLRPEPIVASAPTAAERALLPTLSDVVPPPVPIGEAHYKKQQIGRALQLEYRFEPAAVDTIPAPGSRLREALAEDIGKPLPIKMITLLYLERNETAARQTYERMMAIWLTNDERRQENALSAFADEAFGIRLRQGRAEQGGFAIFRVDNRVLLTMFYGVVLPPDEEWSTFLQPYLQRLSDFGVD